MKPLANLLFGLSVLVMSARPASAEKPLNVVATLSTFADLAKMVGGEHVVVSTIASPKFNPHFIEPKPSDVLKVKKADLFVHAGLDLEAWRQPLTDAAGNRAVMAGGERELDLSRGIALLEVPDRPVSRAEGDIHLYGNPHYWTDPDNAAIMAQTLCDKLCALDSNHEQDYHRRLRDFLDRLKEKRQQWQAQLASFHGQELVGYHNEWPYLMRFAGLRMEQFLEPKPGIPPTPKQVELIEQHIKNRRIAAIVQSTYFQKQTADIIAKRTGATVILLCQNVREIAACADYIATVNYNVNQLVSALSRTP